MNRFLLGLRNGLIISIIVWAIILLFGFAAAYADNSVRIQELTSGIQKDVQDIQQAQTFIQQKQQEALKKQGAIEELQKLDVKTTGTRNK